MRASDRLKVVYIFSFSADFPPIILNVLKDEILPYTVWESAFLGPDLFLLRELPDGTRDIVSYPQSHPLQFDIPATEEYLHLASCNIERCLYLGCESKGGGQFSIWKATRSDDGTFTTKLWLANSPFPDDGMRVSVDGRLLMFWRCQETRSCTTRIYDRNGVIVNEIAEQYEKEPHKKLLKFNCNIATLCHRPSREKPELIETRVDGTIVQTHNFSWRIRDCFAYKHDGFVSCNDCGRLEFWDREFNSLDFEFPESYDFALHHLWHLHYDFVRNEIVSLIFKDLDSTRLIVFKLSD